MSADHLHSGDTMTRAMALNLATWTYVSAQCLGVQTFRTDSLWWRRPGGSPIYLGAVIVGAQTASHEIFADLRVVQEAWGAEGLTVYDCWAKHDLGKIGLKHLWTTPWYVRPPSKLAASGATTGLTVESVSSASQLADFEEATVEGFEMAEAERLERFSQHALATLDDPGMVYLNARLDGQVVASTIVYITDDMVGIYGISTLPRFRRRGYATALVRAAVALRPDLPVSVYPDPPSLPIYSGIDFVYGGEIAVWESEM